MKLIDGVEKDKVVREIKEKFGHNLKIFIKWIDSTAPIKNNHFGLISINKPFNFNDLSFIYINQDKSYLIKNKWTDIYQIDIRFDYDGLPILLKGIYDADHRDDHQTDDHRRADHQHDHQGIFHIIDMVDHKKTFINRYHLIKQLFQRYYHPDQLLQTIHLEIFEWINDQYLLSFLNNLNTIKKYNYILLLHSNKLTIGQVKNQIDQPIKSIITIPLPRDETFRKVERMFWLGRDDRFHDNYYIYSRIDDQLYRHELVVIKDHQDSQKLIEMFEQWDNTDYSKYQYHQFVGKLIKMKFFFNFRFRKWCPSI